MDESLSIFTMKPKIWDSAFIEIKSHGRNVKIVQTQTNQIIYNSHTEKPQTARVSYRHPQYNSSAEQQLAIITPVHKPDNYNSFRARKKIVGSQQSIDHQREVQKYPQDIDPPQSRPQNFRKGSDPHRCPFRRNIKLEAERRKQQEQVHEPTKPRKLSKRRQLKISNSLFERGVAEKKKVLEWPNDFIEDEWNCIATSVPPHPL